MPTRGKRLSVEGQVIAPTLTASLVYDDAREGIRWLVDVLGFKLATLYETPNGDVAFAELTWRTGLVFVSGRPPSSNPWSKVGPASIALAAQDAQAVDHLYQRAVVMGAEIVRPVHDTKTPAFPDGSYQFDLRDPGGNLWTVGTFQPRVTVKKGAGMKPIGGRRTRKVET
jgi:uncharacterized glyoxalase superfamily protein PhnB